MELSITTTEKQQVKDITDEVQSLVTNKAKTVTVFVAHTTCAITTADLDPGTDLDMLDAIKAMIPNLQYRHPHDPAHVWTHIASSLIGPSVTIPITDGKLLLGTWQRIVLIELDVPRQRQVIITLV